MLRALLVNTFFSVDACPTPDPVPHATFDDKIFLDGDKLKFKCEEGYEEVSGDFVWTCQYNGTLDKETTGKNNTDSEGPVISLVWEGTAPICESG